MTRPEYKATILPDPEYRNGYKLNITERQQNWTNEQMPLDIVTEIRHYPDTQLLLDYIKKEVSNSDAMKRATYIETVGGVVLIPVGMFIGLASSPELGAVCMGMGGAGFLRGATYTLSEARRLVARSNALKQEKATTYKHGFFQPESNASAKSPEVVNEKRVDVQTGENPDLSPAPQS